MSEKSIKKLYNAYEDIIIEFGIKYLDGNVNFNFIGDVVQLGDCYYGISDIIYAIQNNISADLLNEWYDKMSETEDNSLWCTLEAYIIRKQNNHKEAKHIHVPII